MSICFKISKFSLFCMDLLLLIVGIVFTVIGIWVAVDNKSFLNLVVFLSNGQNEGAQLYEGSSVLIYSSYGLIIIGGLMILITLFGCWSVISENRKLLISFVVLTSVLILIEVAAAAAIGGTKEKWITEFQNQVKQKFKDNYKGTFGAFTVKEYDTYSLSWDLYMLRRGCCGLYGPKDFGDQSISSAWIQYGRQYQLDRTKVMLRPTACCKFQSTEFLDKSDYDSFKDNMVDSLCPVKENTEFQQTGCFDALNNEFNSKNNLPYISVPIIVWFLQILSIVLAIILIVKIKHWDDELYY